MLQGAILANIRSDMRAGSTPPETPDYWPDTPAPGWLTDDERAASLAAMLAGRAAGEPIWIFGYGSLLWRPAFRAVEQRLAVLTGYHRRFCLVMKRFRGTDECPGLMLALDRGGLCRGMVFRLDPASVEADLKGLWKREMVTGGYRPRWSIVKTAEGPVRAISFVANRANDRYLKPDSMEYAAEMIARACGPVGTNAEYLHSTHEHLLGLGISDKGLAQLDRLVRAKLAR